MFSLLANNKFRFLYTTFIIFTSLFYFQLPNYGFYGNVEDVSQIINFIKNPFFTLSAYHNNAGIIENGFGYSQSNNFLFFFENTLKFYTYKIFAEIIISQKIYYSLITLIGIYGFIKSCYLYKRDFYFAWTLAFIYFTHFHIYQIFNYDFKIYLYCLFPYIFFILNKLILTNNKKEFLKLNFIYILLLLTFNFFNNPGASLIYYGVLLLAIILIKHDTKKSYYECFGKTLIILLITLIKLFFFIYLFFGSIEINQIFASHLESFGQEISKVNADHIMNSFDILRGSGSWWDKHMWMGEPYNSISYLFSSNIIFLLIYSSHFFLIFYYFFFQNNNKEISVVWIIQIFLVTLLISRISIIPNIFDFINFYIKETAIFREIWGKLNYYLIFLIFILIFKIYTVSKNLKKIIIFFSIITLVYQLFNFILSDRIFENKDNWKISHNIFPDRYINLEEFLNNNKTIKGNINFIPNFNFEYNHNTFNKIDNKYFSNQRTIYIFLNKLSQFQTIFGINKINYKYLGFDSYEDYQKFIFNIKDFKNINYILVDEKLLNEIIIKNINDTELLNLISNNLEILNNVTEIWSKNDLKLYSVNKPTDLFDTNILNSYSIEYDYINASTRLLKLTGENINKLIFRENFFKDWRLIEVNQEEYKALYNEENFFSRLIKIYINSKKNNQIKSYHCQLNDNCFDLKSNKKKKYFLLYFKKQSEYFFTFITYLILNLLLLCSIIFIKIKK